jgi:mRNA-degrading endonuclease HigB of HigAB toxin-antitoxin module
MIGTALGLTSGRYETPGALRADFASVSLLGNTCAVFNIGGTRYRLVAYVLSRTKRVYIRHVLTTQTIRD